MLKQLMLSRKIQLRKTDLDALLEQEKEIQTRSAALEAAFDEAETDEELNAVEEEVTQLEADQAALTDKKSKLEGEIASLEGEMEELKSKEPEGGKEQAVEGNKRGGDVKVMTRTKFFQGMTRADVDAFIARDDVKDFLVRVRELIGQQRAVTGADLTIPDAMLGLLRDNLHRYSKLISKVNVKPVSGKARQTVAGAIPEGIWMEAIANLNELDIKFNEVEVDGYKVGGFIPIPNSTLEDSELNLANEIMDALGQAIGYAVDKAILYGSGTKMPLGIATRLAQTSAPDDWNANAPAWTDLHTTNVLKINPGSMTAQAFFAALLLDLAVAKPDHATGGTFWCMNRKTHMNLLSKAITFNAAGALVAGMNNTMPVEGGEIIELEFVPDNDIIGGFGSLYLLAERAGAQMAVSEHVRFLQDQTVFKGTARYDGAPVFGEGFVIVNINNGSANTSKTFATDYANTDIGALGVTSAASSSTSGDTVITVTGAELSGTTLAYKVAGKAVDVANGSKPTGFTAWDGSDEITAATGKVITVVELNAAGQAIKVGSCSITAKA